MPIPVSWPVIGGTPYSVPVTGETNWGNLTNYLVALSTAQGTQAQKFGARVATATPVIVTSAIDCAIVVNLTVPGPSVVQLPPGVNGQFYNISDGKGDAGVNNITILPAVGATINNGPSFVINSNNDAIGLIYTATNNNWKVTSQILSFTPGSVARNAIQAGTPNYVVINAPVTGLLSEEQYLANIRGGFGTDTSAFTGVVKALSGSFSASPIVDADIAAGANIDISKIAPGTVTTAQFARVSQMGRYAATTKITGGVASINGGNPALFDLTAGTGQIIDYVSNPLNPLYIDVTWPSFSAQTVTNLATADITYVLIDSAGAIVQQTSFPTPAQQRQSIFVTRLNHSNRTSVQFVDNIGGDSASAPNQLMDLFDALGPFNISGNLLSANGANLNINKSLGTMFERYFNQVATPLNPHVVTNAALAPASFFYQTRAATVGISTIAVQPDAYDPAGVVVTPVPGGANVSTIQRVFLFPSNNIRIQYGQTAYPTLADAVAAVTTDPFVINPTNVGFPILIGFIVLTRTATQLNNPAQARFIPAGRFAGGSTGAAGGTTALQGAYNNSVSPILTLSALVGAFNIRDNAIPLVGSLFNVQNNAASISYIDVSSQGVKSNQFPTAGRVMVTDVNSAASQSAVTSTELGYLAGTTGVTGTGSIVRNVSPVINTPDIDGGTASNTSRITIPKNTYANLLTLTRKEGTILYATDLDLFFADDGIALSPIGSGGSLNTNMIANPNNATGWSRTGSLFAVPVTTTTAGDLPLGGIVSSAIQLVSSNSGPETTDYVSYAVTTPATFGGKLQINFFQKPGTGFVAGQWTLSVYQGSTRQSLSSDSSGVTIIPNVNGPFTVSMDALASTAYTLRFARTSGAGSATLNIANVFFGFPAITQGAAISEWQAYNPVLGNGPTTTSLLGYWRRVGSSMEITGSLAVNVAGPGSQFTVAIPPGYTINTSAIGAVNRQGIGTLSMFDSGVGHYTGTAFYVSTTTFGFVTNKSVATVLLGSDLTNLDQCGWSVFLPISEFAGNGTVNLGPGAQVEYAATSGTWTADSSTTIYGPGGQQMAGALPSLINKTVTWQYPIQNGDVFVVETSKDRNTWYPLNYGRVGAAGNAAVIPCLNGAGTELSGVYIDHQSATQTRVTFGRYSSIANDDVPVADWPSDAYWRVSKAKASSPVGFGVAGTDGSAGLYKPGLVPGYTVNAPIPAGYVGELKSATGTINSNTAGIGYEVANTGPLSPGKWIIYGSATWTGVAGFTVGQLCTNTSPNVFSGVVVGANHLIGSGAAAAGLFLSLTLIPNLITVTGTPTYYLNAQNTGASNVVTQGAIIAIRIA